VAGFVISGVEPSVSAVRQLISKMDLKEIGYGDGRLMELAQDLVKLRTFVLAMLTCRLRWLSCV
jgi:hypothetical protein